MANSIGSVFIDIKADTSHLVQGFDRAEKMVGKATDTMVKMVGAVGFSLSAISLKNLIDEQAELAKQASLTAEQYAITTEELTKYHYVAEKAGVSAEKFNDALKDAGTKVTEFQRDGESAKEAFLALGINQKFAKEHMQTSSETMEVLLQKFAEFPDGMQKATIAQEIFGDEGSNVIRVANLGADAIKRYTEEAIRGNIATSEAFAQKSKAYLEAEHRLAALQNGWKSAVIEESQFLEVGTNMYNILGDAVMNWTVEVQAGNSSFVNGLESIALNTEAIFPTVIEIWGIFWGSVVDVGSAVLEVGGSFLSTVGDIVGFNDSSLDSISTLGKFVGVAMGATMAIENFAGLVKLSANGLSYFGAMVQSQAIAKLNLLSASYYETMASITSLMGLIDDDFDKDSRAYLEKARDANFAAAKAMEEGNRKYEVLAKERSSILSNFHSVDQIKNQIKETMISVTVAQRKVTKEHESNSKKIAKSVKDREKEIAKNGAMSVKSLTKTMDAIKKLEDEKQNKSLSNSKATLAHQKALKSEATALKNLKKEQIRLEKEHIKEIEDALGLELQTLKIERLKKELSGKTFTPVENIQNDLSLLEKQSVILKSQKDINDNTIAHLQKEIELKKAIRDENEKALKDAYELANLNLKLLITDSEINNSALSKVDILQKELAILHSIDGQSTNQKETLQHQIDLKNKELEISQEVERARKEQSDWEQREAQIAIDRVEAKYDAELRWQELLGNDTYVENAKYEKMAWEFREAGVETTAEQIKQQQKLNRELDAMRGSLAQIVDDMLNGATLADGFSSLVQESTRASIFDFSEQFSKAITNGFEDVDYQALGESAGIALANMMTSQIIANNQDSARQRDGTAIGGGIGTAVGSYFGGAVGGAVGGTIGSYLGGEIAGGERENYVNIYANGKVSAREFESGGWFDNNSDVQLDRETLKIQLAFNDVKKIYEDILDGLLDSTDSFLSISGKFGSDLELQQAVNENFFRNWVGLGNRVNSELMDDFDADGVKKYYEDRAGVIFDTDEAYREYLLNAIDENVNGLYHGLGEITDLARMRNAVTFIDHSNENVAEMEAKAKELEIAWENYAEATEQSTQQAISSILGDLNSTSVKIDEYALRADEDKQKLLAYRAERLRNQEKDLEDFLGYGDVTLENFQAIYDEASHNADLTPEQAIKLNELGDVLLRTGANADDLKSHIEGLKSSFLSDRTSEIASYSTSIINTEEKIAQLQAENSTASSDYAQKQLDYTNKIATATRDMIESISKTFEDEINRLRGIGQDDETQKVQNLIKFNDLEQQYRDIVNGGGAIDQANLEAIQSEMISLSNTLGVSENTGMSEALINALTYDQSLLENSSITATVSDPYPVQQETNDLQNTEEIRRLQALLDFEKWLVEGNNLLRTVNEDFAIGYSKSHDLSREQARELYEISKDGDITQEELKSLNSWSAEMVAELRKEIQLPPIVVNVDVSGNITVDSVSASWDNPENIGVNQPWLEGTDIYVPAYAPIAYPEEQATISLPSYAGGGFTGTGSRSGGVDGIGGFNAILHPNEMVLDLTKMKTQSQNNGVFREMLNELKAVKKELEELKESNLKQEKQATITSIESRKTRKILEEA